MKNLFFLIVFLAILSGFLLPFLAVFKNAIPYLIGIMLVFNFLDLVPNWRLLIRKELIFTLSLSAFIMPVMVYYLLSNGLILEYRIGLFLTAIAPSGILMLVLSRFVPHKDYNLIIANFLATQFGVILYLPLMADWILGASLKIDPTRLFAYTALLILLPFILSRIIRKLCPDYLIEGLKKRGKQIIPILVFFIVSSSIASTAGNIKWSFELFKLFIIVFLIYTIQGGLGYITGMLMGDKALRNTLALIASSRNIQLMFGIAVISFDPLVLIPMILGILIHHVTNLIWLWLFRN